MKYLVLIDYKWRTFNPKKEEPVYKLKKRRGRDYSVLCILYPIKEAVEDLRDYLNEDVFEKVSPKSTKEDTVILFHKLSPTWAGDKDDFIDFKNWVKTRSNLFVEYQGDQHWVYNEIVEKLGDWDKLDAKNLPGWETIKKKFYIDYLESISASLFPLHLALQSFFAISRDKEIGWQTLPDDLPEQAKKNYSKLFSKEYREKAFLLVKEAKYDFFAEIGRRLAPFDHSAQKKPIDEQPLLNLVEEIFKEKIILDFHGFKDEENHELNGKALKEKLEYIISDEKSTLKSLCAILSNISDDGLNPGNKESKNDVPGVHERRIKESRELLRALPECREWLQKPSHTKWPKDLDGDGDADEPDDSYRNLVDQLIEWNSDDEKARTVIEKIETIGFYLKQIIGYYEEEEVQ